MKDGVKKLVKAYFAGEKGMLPGHVREGRIAFFEDLKRHLVLTKDGSYTLPSAGRSGISENMHDMDGGFLEAYEKYYLPCKVSDGSRILDLFSGLGYNAAFALSRVDVEICMVESSPEVLALSLVMRVPEAYMEVYSRLRGSVEEALCEVGFLEHRLREPDPKVSVVVSDAKEEVKKLPPDHFDAVFFDPFSARIAPELYTSRFLSDIRRVMSQGAVLSTFSTSRALRRALEGAGFEHISKFKTHRKTGTIAF